MAAPHVAGAVALYLQDHPTATPSSVTQLLQSSAALDVVGDEGSGSPDRLLQIGFNTVTIQASTGHYFSAVNGGGGDLDANRTSVGIWEKLNLVDTNGGSLVSGDYVYLQSYYGKFMVAESGGGSTLEANRTDPGPWETFRVWKQNGSGTIVSGDTIALQASNSNYVCAEGGGGGEVNANRSSVGAWEKLTINFIGW
jgi:subtilisin family serine protease